MPPRSDLVVTPTTATTTAAVALTSRPTVECEPPGRGELNNAATWDDFPNGRFGDYKSPAFGAQDQWGGLGLSVLLFLLQNYAFFPLTSASGSCCEP